MKGGLEFEQYERVVQNQKLVYHLLKKVNVPPCEYEDLSQVGMIGLVKAAATFDETRQIKFATYASRCINNEINMYFRRNKKHLGNVSLNEPFSKDNDGRELLIEDTISDPMDSNFTDKIESTEMIETAVSIVLNCFSMREKIILLFSMGGVNQKKIAEYLSISQSYVSRLENKLHKRVKQYVISGKIIERKVFSMEILEGKFRITFSTTDAKKFNKAFASFLMKATNNQKMQNFKIACTNGKVIMYLMAEPESFALIAEILLELDNYKLEYNCET